MNQFHFYDELLENPNYLAMYTSRVAMENSIQIKTRNFIEAQNPL